MNTEIVAEEAASNAVQDHVKETARKTLRELRQERWLANTAVLATLALYIWLPEKLTFGPTWLMPLCAFMLLVPISISVPHSRVDRLHWQRLLATALIVVITAANIFSLMLLVDSLLHSGKATGGQLVFEAAKIWLTNVLVFALWFWEMDRGGPGERLWSPRIHPDFLFPQMTATQLAPTHWKPNFVDYLYVSFTNASAFSPTDALPLTRWAKMLMLAQSMTSLLTVVLVTARAVNILT